MSTRKGAKSIGDAGNAKIRRKIDGRYVKFLNSGQVVATIGNVETAGNWTWYLNTIPTGVGPSQRIGNHIKLIRLKGTMSLRGSNTTSATMTNFQPNLTRWVVFVDRKGQASLTEPAYTDLFVTGARTGPQKVDTDQRYHVLMDKQFWTTPNYVGAATAGINNGLCQTQYTQKVDIDLGGIPVEYTAAGTTGAVGEVIKGALYSGMIGDLAAGTEGTTAISAYVVTDWTLYFTDEQGF